MEVESNESGEIYMDHDGHVYKAPSPKMFSDICTPFNKEKRPYKYRLGYNRDGDRVSLGPMTADKDTTLADFFEFKKIVENMMIATKVERVILPAVSNKKLAKVLPRFGFEEYRERKNYGIFGIPAGYRKKLDH